MLGHGKSQESIGWLPAHLGRHPALEGVESWGELLIAVLPRRAFGEEYSFEGGKAWLTSHFEEAH